MKQFFLACLFCTVFLFNAQASTSKFIPQSELIHNALAVISERYVAPERISSSALLQGAFDELALTFSPVMIKSKKDKHHLYIKVTVDSDVKEFDVQRLANVDDLNNVVQSLVKYIKQNLPDNTKLQKVDYAVIKGMLKKLDPHSSLIVPDEYTQFNMSTSGDYGGVGMVISQVKGKIVALYVLDDSPAQKAGLKPNDQLVRIGEQTTLNMFPSEVADLLRGKASTKVKVYIMRKGFKTPRQVELTRARLSLNSVYSHIFKKGNARVGYMQIQSFQSNTFNQVAQQIDDFEYESKDFKGVILDLRNNPGGLLVAAIGISDLFLKKGVIVSTANAHRKNKQSYNASWFKTLDYFPIVVLVNGDSASAAEILSGALKRNNRAVLIGQRTFGKGSVQQIIPLQKNTILKLTTAQYLTPGDYSIQSVGIEPNIMLVPYFLSHKGLVMSPQNYFGEKDLTGIFKWGNKLEKSDYVSYYLLTKENKKYFNASAPRYSKKELVKWLKGDYLTQTSVAILVNNNKAATAKLKRVAIRYVKQQEQKQEQNLIHALATKKINWNKAPYKKSTQKALSARFWFTKKVGKKWNASTSALVAGGDYRLYAEVKNNSTHVISRIKANSKATETWNNGIAMVFGTLKPKQKASWYYEFSLPKNVDSVNKKLSFVFKNQKQTFLKKNVVLNIQNQGAPRFTYSLLSSTVKDNKEGDIKKLHFQIANKAATPTGKLEVFLRNGEGDNLFLIKGKTMHGSLKKGESFQGDFSFRLKQVPKDKTIDVSLTVIDKLYVDKSFEEKLKIPVEKETWQLKNALPYFTDVRYPLVAKNNKAQLSFVVQDDSSLKDTYLFVNNHKVFYQNYETAKNKTQAHVNTTLRLKKGMNQVVLIARDDRRVMTEKKLFIRY